jgi:hypothetical protein
MICKKKTPPQAPNKHSPMPRIPISTTASDYTLTQQDIEVAYFLRNSYAQAEVVLVGDNVALTVQMLVPNVTKQMIYDQVRQFLSHSRSQALELVQPMPNLVGLQIIDSFAYVSELDIAPMSVLSTFDTRKLTGENGPIQILWAKRIAQKCIG